MVSQNDSQVYLFGGTDQTDKRKNDVVRFDIAKNAFFKVNVFDVEKSPPGIDFH